MQLSAISGSKASISVPHTLVTETCAPIRSSGPNGVMTINRLDGLPI